jgi:AbrB family looped-hinge helix DNA binding protein
MAIHVDQSKKLIAMEVEIDDYGRIVIPKEVRDHLGIDSGTALKISVEPEEGDGGAITLRPKEQRPPLRRKGELLVHSGELTEKNFDVTEQLRAQRTDRARLHAGIDK